MKGIPDVAVHIQYPDRSRAE